MSLHNMLLYIAVPIWAAVTLIKTVLEYSRKKPYSKYMIQFIIAVIFFAVGVILK